MVDQLIVHGMARAFDCGSDQEVSCENVTIRAVGVLDHVAIRATIITREVFLVVVRVHRHIIGTELVRVIDLEFVHEVFRVEATVAFARVDDLGAYLVNVITNVLAESDDRVHD